MITVKVDLQNGIETSFMFEVKDAVLVCSALCALSLYPFESERTCIKYEQKQKKQQQLTQLNREQTNP